jgi:hypothetical protein
MLTIAGGIVLGFVALGVLTNREAMGTAWELGKAIGAVVAVLAFVAFLVFLVLART